MDLSDGLLTQEIFNNLALIFELVDGCCQFAFCEVVVLETLYDLNAAVGLGAQGVREDQTLGYTVGTVGRNGG